MNEYPGCTLHQVAPYVGKIRPQLARQLIQDFSNPGDWVWDPFCGSGTVPLESRLLGRNTIAGDVNPYACLLTRAKLKGPVSIKTVLPVLEEVSQSLNSRNLDQLPNVPLWVRRFFHKKTLKETVFLARQFKKQGQYFVLGCLLGILHHQRPGFLSYPASHLVPYLRDRLYPRNRFPEAYEYRDPIPRLKSKVIRVLKYPPPPNRIRYRVFQRSATTKYLSDSSVDVAITSPPYMNALDYARDNRLRLWFLGAGDYKNIQAMEIKKISSFESDMLRSLTNLSKVIKPGGTCIFILGDVKSNGKRYDVSRMITDLVKDRVPTLSLHSKRVEKIPNKRRARRNGRATIEESILIFGRNHGGYYG